MSVRRSTWRAHWKSRKGVRRRWAIRIWSGEESNSSSERGIARPSFCLLTSCPCDLRASLGSNSATISRASQTGCWAILAKASSSTGCWHPTNWFLTSHSCYYRSIRTRGCPNSSAFSPTSTKNKYSRSRINSKRQFLSCPESSTARLPRSSKP